MLLNAYNKCLFEGHVSQKWKIARLVLIRKGDKSLDKLSSYRPICLLDSLGKLFEKIIDNRIQAMLEDNHRLTECQHGFQKKTVNNKRTGIPKKGCGKQWKVAKKRHSNTGH